MSISNVRVEFDINKRGYKNVKDVFCSLKHTPDLCYCCKFAVNITVNWRVLQYLKNAQSTNLSSKSDAARNTRGDSSEPSFHGTLFNSQLLLDPLINSCCSCLFLPSPLSSLSHPSLPLLSFAALVQIPLLLRGRGGVVGGEGVGERTTVSLSTVLLSPPSATLVSSVCTCAYVSFSGLQWQQ